MGWLLEAGPGEWRSLPSLRRHPRALAYRTRCELDARIEGARAAYAGLRAHLGDGLSAQDLAAVLADLEAEGAALIALAREVGLVEEALAGRRWRPRL